MRSLHEILEIACRPGREWAGNKTLPEIWQTCPRGDWMIWLLRKSGAEVSHVQWVRIAIACAEQALIYVPAGEDRPRLAIEAAKAWCDMPTEENRRVAAWRATVAADAADATATWRADAAAAAAVVIAADVAVVIAAAAADAADATATWRADAAWRAAAAADDAAWRAADAADDADVARQKQADMIREIIPNPFAQ